ncbi:CDP-alcohol phosphatidyltransferase family protein [Shewanella canadensis]|uniref:CDP-diacylglycerol--glycerol-3-phosphate 3-phosphatidyltransferase n=1 Tax=Shewanella canadensis TaxID=271096 RepID=A0A3S0KT94_9GAMM|nr:CDP-alcohol phosphatidyltransferase family protein [Shewanella canadensis]RTR37898.1 CDP-alcohol phosphatidyltransferase family protein [Shewanella canadensis]
MASSVIKQIPNMLTTLRLILAIPICLMILNEDYGSVIWIAFIAGLSDGVDGFLARKLNAVSRYGAIVDPISDKVLLVSVYVSFAIVGLLPWWVATVVVIRDLLIVCGALLYHWQFGRYEIAPSIWGKASTFVQITFALMLLTDQVYPFLTPLSFQVGMWSLIVMAFISGGHYFYVWSHKALA